MASGLAGHGRQHRLVARGGVGVDRGDESHLAEEAGVRGRPEAGRESSRTAWWPAVLGLVGHGRLCEAAGLRLRVLAVGPVGHGWLHEAASLRLHVPASEGCGGQRDLRQTRGM
jgi:hypothetical protein